MSKPTYNIVSQYVLFQSEVRLFERDLKIACVSLATRVGNFHYYANCFHPSLFILQSNIHFATRLWEVRVISKSYGITIKIVGLCKTVIS